MNPNQIQQGDVTLERIDKLPDGCKARKRAKGRSVLSEGSQSGNSHYFDAQKVTIHDGPDGVAYVTNDNPTPVDLKHTRDHDPVRVANGTWRVGGINELDPLTEMVNKVVD